jgi:hypothetical protein
MQRRGPPIILTKSFGLVSAPSRPAAVPDPALTVSNAPTDFYRQHHTVEAPAIDEREFRPAWRVKSRLMMLVEYGRIDRRQLEAAAAFKGWCEAVGRHKSSAWLAVRVDGGRCPDGLIAPNQLEAARRLDAARLALGRDRVKLLFWAIVDELPWDRIAQTPRAVAQNRDLPGHRGDRRPGTVARRPAGAAGSDHPAADRARALVSASADTRPPRI